MRLILPAILALLAVPAFALAQAPASKQQCFPARQLGATHAPDDSTLYASVANDIWVIKMSSPCHNLSFNPKGILLNLHSGISQICGPPDLDITVAGAGGTKCFVGSVSKLSPAEAAAIPRKDRP